MVHADYASAETCLPRQGRGAGGRGQDYCGHVAVDWDRETWRKGRGKSCIGRGEYLKWMLQNGCCYTVQCDELMRRGRFVVTAHAIYVLTVYTCTWLLLYTYDSCNMLSILSLNSFFSLFNCALLTYFTPERWNIWHSSWQRNNLFEVQF